MNAPNPAEERLIAGDDVRCDARGRQGGDSVRQCCSSGDGSERPYRMDATMAASLAEPNSSGAIGM